MKQRVVYTAIGLASVLVLTPGEVSAQCNGGRGGQMSTGSTSSLTSGLPYSANPLAMNYPSSIALMATQYQERAAMVQNQYFAMAYENEQRQRLAAIARDEAALPYRLARAEANRAKRAERIAARLREQHSDSQPPASESYSLTAVTAD